ncbi:hypothetical protein K3495_g54 [Podosphaera aphanis]|nr:hypothetical protein K3495_g54 [Podosphaera aphanis]
MVFIVSTCKEDHSKISEQVYRIGFHFRESVIETAREFLGESQHNYTSDKNFIEPIPKSQEEINKQADAAIRDLFPRIPNTDRRMVIEHAFKKGAMFQGEPTVGTQSNIPLSRRVQLAILAHIRHNHTRYDKLLRETSWMNARKAVEPVCLDIILKWRGDEETGRDQMDEILREVVIISDSEDDEEDDLESVSSNEEQDAISSYSPDVEPQTNLHNQSQDSPVPTLPTSRAAIIRETHGQINDRRARRGFKRYQAAWQEALHRQQEPHGASQSQISYEAPLPRKVDLNNHGRRSNYHTYELAVSHSSNPKYYYSSNDQWQGKNYTTPFDAHLVPTSKLSGSLTRNGEVPMFSPHTDRILYHHDVPQRTGGYKYRNIEQPLPHIVANHSSQDMLVNSIETAPQGALSRPETRSFVSDRLNYAQDSNVLRTRGIAHQTPAHQQVIIIDDDSPEVKRRRMTYEDDFGHCRPLSPRNHDVASTCQQQFDHPSNSVSTGQSREYRVRPLRTYSQYAQETSRNVSPTNIDPATTGRGPVYDAQHARFLSPLPKIPGRAGTELRPRDYVEHIDLTLPGPAPNFDHHSRRLSDGQLQIQRPEVSERTEHAKYINGYHRSWSPQSYAPIQSSRTYETAPSILRPIHHVEYESYHYPADGFALRAMDHPTVISGREFLRNNAQPQHHGNNENSNSFVPPRLRRARSPLRISERPMYSPERSSRLVYHNQPPNRPWKMSPVVYSRRQQFPPPMDERH